ncbi:MAG: hypothetical protein HUK26_09945, partial [Duodenibacillus sp.]|nr:hypothetical protein [Duodenibacillus sp.]
WPEGQAPQFKLSGFRTAMPLQEGPVTGHIETPALLENDEEAQESVRLLGDRDLGAVLAQASQVARARLPRMADLACGPLSVPAAARKLADLAGQFCKEMGPALEGAGQQVKYAMLETGIIAMLAEMPALREALAREKGEVLLMLAQIDTGLDAEALIELQDVLGRL